MNDEDKKIAKLIGKNIERLIRLRGFKSIDEFSKSPQAEKFSLPKETLYRYSRGERVAGVKVLLKLKEALKIKMDDFFEK